MSMTLKPGTRLFSAVCATEMITVKVPKDEVELTIGGAAPVLTASSRTGAGTVADGHGGGAAMGKRYVDAADTIELLCTKPGAGVPAVNGVLLEMKGAKALPASD
jgi:hypothetical protein